MKNPTRWILYATTLYIFVHFYRRLPDNFTDSRFDLFIMKWVELILRFTYVYPSRLCPDAYCQLVWTRFTLEKLMGAIGPKSLHDTAVNITEIQLDSRPSRVYIPHNRSNDGAIFYVHGGGYVLGSMDMYESLVRQIVKNSRMVTFAFDYRLAPEYIFPTALDDCDEAFMDLMTRAYKDYGVNRERIVLMGDSAGGGLVASLTFRIRHRKNIPQPKAQVLMYPLVQFHNYHTPSYDNFYRQMKGTAFVEPKLIAQYYLMYTGADVKSNPALAQMVLDNRHVSHDVFTKVEEFINFDNIPDNFKYNQSVINWNQNYDKNLSTFLAPFLQNSEFAPIVEPDLSGVPPALVVTMEHDVLRDEGALYVHRLKEAGIPTTWKHFETGFHAMYNFHDTIATSARALRFVSDWALENV